MRTTGRPHAHTTAPTRRPDVNPQTTPAPRGAPPAQSVPAALKAQVEAALKKVEAEMGLGFGMKIDNEKLRAYEKSLQKAGV